MSRKHFTTEKVIGMLREAEVSLTQGIKVGKICLELKDIGAELRDEVLNRGVFFALQEAKVVIEIWRRECNTIRPHSSLNGRLTARRLSCPSAFDSLG